MSYQIELKDIVKDYKKFRAVDKINLSIPKGKIVSLLGPSGCGKTTTLRVIAGLLTPTEGSVFVDGKDITSVAPYKRDIAMVFQNYALFPHLSVFDNIVYGLRNRGIKDKAKLKKEIEGVVSIVQLEDVIDRFPRQLSGGQQQRVSLARALAVEPKVMLFDEPLCNLDAKLRVKTRVEIRNLLKKMNITAIYVTHDQEEALTISDMIAVMNNGKIEQLATPTELYNGPETKFVADFIGHANIFEGEIVDMRDGYATVDLGNNISIQCTAPSTCEINGSCNAILVRPENIKLTAEQPNCENGFPAKLLEENFLGSTIRYNVQIASGAEIEVEVHPDQALKNGLKDVYVSFEKSKAILVS